MKSASFRSTRPHSGTGALATAVEIVRAVAMTGEPADRILRERLKTLRTGGVAGAEIAGAVFAWFRWRGFLTKLHPDETGIGRALEFDARFARAPERFETGAMLERAVPPWVREELDVTIDWTRALQRKPPLWLRARPGQAGVLAGALSGARAGLVAGLPDAVRYEGEADLFRTTAFLDGRFEIQDIASQAVGAVCAPRPGETWWDACAGEGGKTLHLADQMENRGLIWATDRSPRRLALLKRRAARARLFNFRSAVWPEVARLPTRTRFDGVLVDAPCSGLGTWSRNPHARWTTTRADVLELAEVQTRLLDATAAAVKPGGRLVFAACTLTHSETMAVAARFDEAHKEFEPFPFADPFDGGRAPEARRLWWPQATGGNGMFVAAWRRVSH